MLHEFGFSDLSAVAFFDQLRILQRHLSSDFHVILD